MAAFAAGYAVETVCQFRFTLTNLLRNAIRDAGGDNAIRNQSPLQIVILLGLVSPLAALARAPRADALAIGAIGPPQDRVRGYRVGGEVTSLHHLDQARYAFLAFRCSALGMIVVGLGLVPSSHGSHAEPRESESSLMSPPEQTAPEGPVWVWGVPFAPWTLARTVDEVERLITRRLPAYFMTVNLHTTMLIDNSPEMRAVVDGAAFVNADGMPLVWASRFRRRRLPERVAGADLVPALCERAAQNGYRVFFLGGAPGVGERAAANLRTRFPGLQIVGIESPPYRPTTAQEETDLLDRIRATRPHLLMVAFGQPKGELWVHRHSPTLPETVCVQVGGSLDFAAGRISRAPRWMQRTGLEWVYRLSREPRRLFMRYVRNAAFVARMLWADLIGRKERLENAEPPANRR